MYQSTALGLSDVSKACVQLCSACGTSSVVSGWSYIHIGEDSSLQCLTFRPLQNALLHLIGILTFTRNFNKKLLYKIHLSTGLLYCICKDQFILSDVSIRGLDSCNSFLSQRKT